jgi:hypothetical protein
VTTALRALPDSGAAVLNRFTMRLQLSAADAH